jgi:hypothetical protein
MSVQNEYLQALAEFTRPDCDRLDFITRFLSTRGLKGTVLSVADSRFVHVLSPGSGLPLQPGVRPLFTAHYDRAPDTPAANDNSAAVLALLFFLTGPARKKISVPFELLLTDREESPAGSSPRIQGAFRLGELLKKKEHAGIVFYHFDMCGRGDTIVLSEAGERLLGRRRKTKTALYRKMKALRTAFLDNKTPALRGRLMSLPTPFSDNLGFLLQGFPVLQITFLPRRESAEFLQSHKTLMAEIAGLEKRTPETAAAYKERFDAIQPPTWKLRHTPADTIASLSPEAFGLMQDLCAALLKWRAPK